MLPSVWRSLVDHSVTRSHPNKAVDVFANQTSKGRLASARSTHVGSAPSSGFRKAVAGNGSAWVSCFWTLAGYAASVVGAPCRSGSYSSPLTHSRCNSTANFRATATAARFFAFFPPRSHSRSPYRRKSVSAPNGPQIYWALPTRSQRSIPSPALLIRKLRLAVPGILLRGH